MIKRDDVFTRFRRLRMKTVAGGAGVFFLAALGIYYSLLHGVVFRQNSKDAQRAGVKPSLNLDLEVGDRLCLPRPTDARFSAPLTVIIVAKAGCPACQADQPFEELLYARCMRLGIPVINLLPNKKDQENRARQLISLGRKVVRVELTSAGVSRVPSLISVDPSGMIKAMWTGSVPLNSADTILERIVSGIGSTPYHRIRWEDIEQAAKREAGYQILALAEGGKPLFAGANYRLIPLAELNIRANYELDKYHALFVDCSMPQISPGVCQEALLTLSAMNFNRLFAVGLPRRMESGYCEN